MGNFIGIKTSITSGRAVNLHAIGALTRVGAGGRAVGVANGVYGPYTVASGILTPNTTPVTPGNYSVGGMTVLAEANTYDVATGELAAVIALGSASLDGKTIKIAPGADACGSAIGSTVTLATTVVIPTGLTITSRSLTNKGFLRRLYIRPVGRLRLEDLIIRDFWKNGDYPHYPIIDRDTNSSGSPNTDRLEMHRVEFYSDTLTPADLAPASATSVTTGIYYRINTVILANWTSVGGPVAAVVGDSFLSTATTSIVLLGAVHPYPRTLRLLAAAVPGANQTRELEILDSYLHNCEYGITGQNKSLRIERTRFNSPYADAIQVQVKGTETLFRLKDNWFQGAVGNTASPFGFHNDLFQINLIEMTQNNTTPYELIGNRVWGKDTTALTQAFFIENFNASRFDVTIDVRQNLIMAGLAQGIVCETASATSVIRWNTIAYDQNALALDAGALVPKIIIEDEEGGVAVRENLHSGFAYGTVPLTLAKTLNNHQFPTFNNAGMSPALVGTTFGRNDFADLAAFTAAMQPKVAGPGDAAYGPKIGAGWYYSYGAAPSGSMSDLGEGTATEPAAIVAAAFTAGQWSATPANLKITVSVTAMPLDGGAYVTSIQYRLNGGAWTASGISAVGNFDITGLTNGTSYDVELRSVNSAGNAVASDLKSATPINTYTINAVEFGASETASISSGFTATGSKFALVAFNFFCASSIPSGNEAFDMSTAGGSIRVTVSYTSSGRFSIIFYNSAGVAVNQLTTAASSIVANTWYTVILGIDNTLGSIAARFRAQIRPSGGSWSDLTTGATTHTATLDGIIDTCGRIRFNNLPATAVYYADAYIRLDATLDISSSTNRDKFLPATDKGSDGSTPTGSAPAVFLSGVTASWHTNKGTGGGLTLTGTLSTAPSAPT